MKNDCRSYVNIVNSEKLRERGISVKFFYEIDSTNTEARRYAVGGEDAPALFVANRQSEGRGRLGRSFYSPSDTGVYMTLLLEIKNGISQTVGITSAAAVAVLRATDTLTGGKTQIKWVNDILLDGKKICGILAESFFVGERFYAAIGIGLNVSTEDFPDELKDIASSIGKSAKEAQRADICERIACELYDLYCLAASGDRSYMKEYKERSAVLGRRISFGADGQTREGIATDIDDGGALLVTLDSGEQLSLGSGEITLRLK